MIQRISYQHSPISSIKSLSEHLRVSEDVLVYIAENRDKYYQQNKPELKPDGKERITYRLDIELKKIQKQIKTRIFNKVNYPEYLQGSIKDKRNPRTYDRNAAIHAGSNFIISEDVSDFFHSIDEKLVNDMWKYLFGFSVDVSELLTKLTTYNGYVPQGGVTSSYLSNLILWDVEPALVEKLNKLNITYTRYIDDVTLSSKVDWLPEKNKIESINSVFAMLTGKGLKPNRTKHKIMGRNTKMVIHKLNVNSGRPTMNKKKRQKIRLEVYNLKKSATVCKRSGEPYKKLYQSVHGKVLELCNFHPTQGAQFIEELKQIAPV